MFLFSFQLRSVWRMRRVPQGWFGAGDCYAGSGLRPAASKPLLIILHEPCRRKLFSGILLEIATLAAAKNVDCIPGLVPDLGPEPSLLGCAGDPLTGHAATA